MRSLVLSAGFTASVLLGLGSACDGEPDVSGNDGVAGSPGEGGDGSGGNPASCGSEQRECQGICTNTDSDPSNCGSCGNACGVSEGCNSGECQRFGCTTGQVECTSGCVDPQTDPANCGGCDQECASGEVCQKGDCVTSCPGTLIACDGTCIDPMTNRDYCGATSCPSDIGGGGADPGVACSAGQVCVAGLCEANCPASQVNCQGACVDPATDRNYCGADSDCQGGVVCSGGDVCSGGLCAASCGQGFLECSGQCVDPLTNAAFCGATACDGTGGTVCATGETCVIGECRAFVRKWGQGGRIDAQPLGVATENALAVDGVGNAVVVFRGQVTASDPDALRPFALYYSAATKSWSAPVQLDSQPYRVRNLRVDMNESGQATAVWTADTAYGQVSNESHIMAAVLDGSDSAYSIDVTGSLGKFAETPDVYVNEDGVATLVYSFDLDDDTSTYNWRVEAQEVDASGNVGPQIHLSTLGGATFAAWNPRVVGNASGQAVVTFWNGVSPRNAFAVRYSPQTGFGTQEQLNGAFDAPFNRAGPPDVAIDADGNIHAVWAQTSGYYSPQATYFPLDGAIFYNSFNGLTGLWGTPSQVSGVTDVAVDPRVATSADGQAALAFQVYESSGNAQVAPARYWAYGNRLVTGVWVEERQLGGGFDNPPTLPVVVVSGNHDIHYAWTQGGAVETARYVALTAEWSAAEQLNTNISGGALFPMLAATSGVNALAGWIQTEPAQAGSSGYGLVVARYD